MEHHADASENGAQRRQPVDWCVQGPVVHACRMCACQQCARSIIAAADSPSLGVRPRGLERALFLLFMDGGREGVARLELPCALSLHRVEACRLFLVVQALKIILTKVVARTAPLSHGAFLEFHEYRIAAPKHGVVTEARRHYLTTAAARALPYFCTPRYRTIMYRYQYRYQPPVEFYECIIVITPRYIPGTGTGTVYHPIILPIILPYMIIR